jgi:hypothetical protein
MLENLKWFFATGWAIIVRPIWFYTKLKGEDWKEKALTFFLINCWVLAFLATVVIFILQYITIGSTLIEGISGLKFVLILPVLLTLIFVFFSITLLILGGLFTAAFFVMFYILAWVLHYVYLFLGGRGSFNSVFQNLLYSSASLLFTAFVFILMLLTHYGVMDFSLFRIGFNLIYFLISLYTYGLWAVVGRRVYGVPKWKAFLGAVAPVIILLIFVVVFDKIALSKLQSLIS